MPNCKSKVPNYRFHKPSGQRVVTLNGIDHYLGQYNTAENRGHSNVLVGRWLASGQRIPDATSHPLLSANELLLAYYRQREER